MSDKEEQATPEDVKHFSKENRSVKAAAGGEGKLTGFIGIKPEQKGPFSLTIGQSESTQLLFQLFIEKVTDLHPQY